MITKRNVLVGLGSAVIAAALLATQAQAHQHTPPQNIHVVQPKPKAAASQPGQTPRKATPTRVWAPTLKRYL